MNIKLTIVLLLLVKIAFTQTDSIDYLGQTPPGDLAVIFAPGIISLPDRIEHQIVFSPDGNECYISTTFNNSIKIYWFKYINNTWTEQMEADHIPGFPFFSADGNNLYYDSSGDIFMVERTDSTWGEPQILPEPINSDFKESFYSETTDGLVYFSSQRTGSFLARGDIWYKHPSYDEAENLGSDINSGEYLCCPYISQDGSFLIFSSNRSDKYGNQDLFICFNKENNKWTKPLNMEESGASINIAGHTQNCPSLSPDQKYLFFRRHNSAGKEHDIYWVSTNIIHELKKIAFAPKLANQIPDIIIKPDSSLNYIIPENTFSCEYDIDSLKFEATLSNGEELPSWLNFNSQTRTLSANPTGDGVFSVTITAINPDTVGASCTFNIISSITSVQQFEDHKIKVYPNPSKKKLQIQ